MNTTTRRHPRTTAEAFNDATRAQWSEGWMRGPDHRWAGRLLAVAMAVSMAFLIVEHL